MTLWGKLVQHAGRAIYGCYRSDLFNGNAMSHTASEAARWCKGTGIDFGAGRWPFPGAVPIDLDTVLQLDGVPSGSQDYVFSSHTLEHIHDWRETLVEFRRVLKEGGVLFLYLPHESMTLWNAETVWGRAADHVWQPTPGKLIAYALMHGWEVPRCLCGWDEYWSWFIVLRKETDR